MADESAVKSNVSEAVKRRNPELFGEQVKSFGEKIMRHHLSGHPSRQDHTLGHLQGHAQRQADPLPRQGHMLGNPHRPLPHETEAVFQAEVVKYAQDCGWLVAHFRPAQTADGSWRTPVAADGKGFPDLVLARNRIIFAELKVGKNKPSDDQKKWLIALRRVGALALVWRPEDWDEIIEVLR